MAETHERLRGIVLLVTAVSLFSIVDGLSQLLANTQSVAQIVWARYAFGIPVLLLTLRPAGLASLFRTSRPKHQIVRALIPIVISVAMVLAVRHLPLSEATVIMFAGPFIVVALSAPLLGETVRSASWIGVVIGFAAVLIVARPGFGDLSAYAIFPLIAAVFYALFQLVTRQLNVAGETPETTLAWTLATGCALSTPAAALSWEPLTLKTGILMIALGLVFGAGHALMIRAFACASANVLTPFSYAQIVAAALFEMIVIGVVPDFWTWVGIAMIVGSGVYIVHSRAGSVVPTKPVEIAK